MHPIFLGLFMLVTASIQAVPPAPLVAGGQFKTMIECKDREIGVLMTLSQWIDPEGVASTIYRITSMGQKVPRFFNRKCYDPSVSKLMKIKNMISVLD